MMRCIGKTGITLSALLPSKKNCLPNNVVIMTLEARMKGRVCTCCVYLLNEHLRLGGISMWHINEGES